jgi:Putative Flp pilus-assembly TadE/G-like
MLKRMLTDRKGGIAMVLAMALPVYIGGAALAVDTIQWSLAKRQMQRQADSGAIAGAFGLAQGTSVAAAVNADLARNNFVALTEAATIENAPLSGPFAGNARAVRVALRTTMRLPFSSFFIDGTVIGAEATAQLAGQGEYCVVALDKASVTGIDMGGNTTVDLGCGMISNTVAANAVDAGNATGGTPGITASPIAAAGGVPASPNYVAGTSLFPYAVPQRDPYAALPDPTSAIGNGSQLKVNANSRRTISEGTYRDVDIKGELTMNPGTYYINGGNFSVSAQASVIGDGVTIILTSQTAATDPSSIATTDINGGATIQLSAPSTGTYAGMIFYQDRRAADSGTNKINGNSSSRLQGAIYFPNQAIQYNGTTGMSTNCLKLVAKRISFTGNSRINNVCPTNSGTSSIPATVVKLVA